MKTYALVNGKHVRYAELRETPKFLISVSDASYKFKKIEKDERIASSKRFSNYKTTGYDVYEVDHPFVLELIENEKKETFTWKVSKELEKLNKQRLTHERAIELNNVLGFGIEL